MEIRLFSEYYQAMNKRLVSLLIVVMTLVLTGLVFIQIYWINNAISLKEQQFDQQVNDAMKKVAQSLERQDAASFFFGEFFTGNVSDQNFDRKLRLFQNKMSRSLDTEETPLNGEWTENRSVAWSEKGTDDPDFKVSLDSNIIMFDTSAKGTYTGTINVQIAESDCQIQVAGTNKERVLKSIQEHVSMLSHRKSVMNEIFFQFFSNERSIHERIPRDKMDVIITEALKEEGIDIPFEFSVITQFGKTVASSVKFDGKPQTAEYRITLFPNDLFSEHNFLLIQFPSKRDYIMQSMSMMSASSIGLIMIISLCFAYTIHIIFRQKKLSDMKTDFVNNMTHELKTPISTISLASEMLRDERVASDTSRISRYAGVIHDENKRLGSHVEKVLQMAVIDKGENKLNLHQSNLHELVQKAIDKMALQLEERGSVLNTFFEAQHPEAPVDETHFTNMISNLLDNAIKYSNDRPEITLKTRNAKGGIFVSVEDKGIGMSKDAQRKVFEKFYRVPTGNVHNVKGFGLGLSYVKAMAEAHGGNVKLKSELHKGSIFEIFIPHSNPFYDN